MPNTTEESYYIGIDVGTGSVRASLVSKSGRVVASSTQETKTWRDPLDHRVFEQSTTDIWAGAAKVIKACLQSSGVDPIAVKGLGFDATCSLAVTDFDGVPVAVTKGEHLGKHGERNIILWADHRAEKEADLINSTGSIVLDYVGGTMSVRPKFLSPTDLDLTNRFVVRNGDTKNPLGQEQHGSRSLLQMPVLRSSGLSHIPSYERQLAVLLLIDVQVRLRTKIRVAEGFLQADWAARAVGARLRSSWGKGRRGCLDRRYAGWGRSFEEGCRRAWAGSWNSCRKCAY